LVLTSNGKSAGTFTRNALKLLGDINHMRSVQLL